MQATFPLSDRFKFFRFETREEFSQKTGLVCPPFAEYGQPKYWFDPDALKSPRLNVLYDNVVAYDEKGHPLSGSDGQPILDVLVLPKARAATVNIPPTDETFDHPILAEVPVPLLPLGPDEELFFATFGIVAIRNRKLYQESLAGFGADDRALLKHIGGLAQAIANKIGGGLW